MQGELVRRDYTRISGLPMASEGAWRPEMGAKSLRQRGLYCRPTSVASELGRMNGKAWYDQDCPPDDYVGRQ